MIRYLVIAVGGLTAHDDAMICLVCPTSVAYASWGFYILSRYFHWVSCCAPFLFSFLSCAACLIAAPDKNITAPVFCTSYPK